MTDFFVLRHLGFAGPMAYFEETVEANTGGFPTCPSCEAPIGMRAWLQPKKVRLGRGTRTRQAGDLVFGTSRPFLASSRLVQAWSEEGLTGIDSWDPVEVRGQPKGAWFHPTIPVATVRADQSRMTLTWKQPPTCDHCQQGWWTRFEGLALEAATWQGQDLFYLLNLPGFTLVSSRFARWAEAHDFENLELVPVADFGRDELLGDLRPGPGGEWERVPTPE